MRPRRFMRACRLFGNGIVLRFTRGGTRDRVLLFGPGAQVDLLAAFGAEWAELVFGLPFKLGAAGGAGYNGHDNGSSKITEGELEWYIFFQRLGFAVPALGGKGHP